jgi:tetratricopeptide (TPR) repeat protein
MSESAFARLWKVMLPPPATGAPARQGLNRKQKRLVLGAATFIVLAGAGGWTYFYMAGAPQRAQAQYQTAMQLMQPGHYQEAITQLSRSIRIYPLANAYVERGFAHRYLAQNDLAATDLEKAAELDPSLARAYSGLGSIYRDRGDSQHALEEYTKSIQTSANVDALFERGEVYESLGQHQKAIDDFSSAIELLRDAPYIYRARAMAKSNMGDTAGAEADRNLARSIESPHH